MKILGKFNKDERYAIVEDGGELFALFNLNADGTYERKRECKEFGPGLYGIGPEIPEQEYTVSIAVDGRIDIKVKASSFEEAKGKANIAFADANLGKLECISWTAINAEREDGEFRDY